MNAAQKAPNPKLEQFLADINKVQEHYQYAITPTLQYTKNGVFPVLTIIDKPPKPMDPTTQPEQPAQSETIQAPAAASEEPTVEVN